MCNVFKLSLTFAILMASSQLQAAIPAAQRDALITLYASTNGANWINKVGWLGELGTECSWFGVVCDSADANVMALELVGNQLIGTIPANLKQLTKIVKIYLNNNCLETSDLELIAYLDSKTPNWRVQTCIIPKLSAPLLPTPKVSVIATPKPAATPTAKPTAIPTAKPAATPTAKPTAIPTAKPTAIPTVKPTAIPTVKPTAIPTAKPIVTPIPNVIAKPSKGVAPLTVTLEAPGVADSSAKYAWRSVEVITPPTIAQVEQAAGKLTSMTFDDPGTFDVTLTVTDKQGKSVTTTQRIVIEKAPVSKPANAIGLLANVPKEGRLLEADVADWYRFYGQKNVLYQLEVRVGAQVYPQVELYNDADKLLATITTKTGEGIRVQGPLPEDGMYKFKITNKAPKITRSISAVKGDYGYALAVLQMDRRQAMVGKIRNSCTGNPLYDVQVNVASDASSYTASSNDGAFSLPINAEVFKKLQARSVGRITFKRGDFNVADYPINTNALSNVEIELTPKYGCETVKAKALFDCAVEEFSDSFYNPNERYVEEGFIRDYASGWSLKIKKDDKGFAYKAPGMKEYDSQFSLDQMNALHCKPRHKGY